MSFHRWRGKFTSHPFKNRMSCWSQSASEVGRSRRSDWTASREATNSPDILSELGGKRFLQTDHTHSWLLEKHEGIIFMVASLQLCLQKCSHIFVGISLDALL